MLNILQDPQEVIKAFHYCELFSKKDLLKSISKVIDHLKNNPHENSSKAAIQKKIELCEQFKKKLEISKIPTLSDSWRCYRYEFTGDGIDLQLCTESDIELDEEGFIASSCTNVDYVLFSVKCDYISVNEFAKMQSVSEDTVNKWINRGRLHHAKKIDCNNWIIPILEEKPSREFWSVQYLFENDKPQIDEYPFLSLCDSIFISKDSDKKSSFTCSFIGVKNSFYEKLNLNRKEVEKLEYDLISSGKANIEPGIQFVPYIR